MFSSCIFCTGPLGRNEALENFPVGRRLAYDAAKGRLWVVCPRCERWNLTPLETRWEAIEEAERAYRGMKLRVSTDNIGLARLREGLELVRVGAPLLPEFAAWRYGDQFGRRRRKYIAIASTSGVVSLVGAVAPLVPMIVGLSSIALAIQLSWRIGEAVHARRRKKRIVTTVRDDAGAVIPLTAQNIGCAALIPPAADGIWQLALPYGPALPMAERDREGWRRGPAAGFTGRAELEGETATRALSAMLPHVNAAGGKPRHVHDAVDVITASASLDRIVRDASVNDGGDNKYARARTGENNVAGLPPHIRLALEIMLHQDDERRAMEGELRELESRWREAEAIASIADSLTLPADIEARLTALKERVPQA